jgi:serine/threonine protein kinase
MHFDMFSLRTDFVIVKSWQVWDYIEQIASGLKHIHSQGVLHLDIKPENIFIDGQGKHPHSTSCNQLRISTQILNVTYRQVSVQ